MGFGCRFESQIVCFSFPQNKAEKVDTRLGNHHENESHGFKPTPVNQKLLLRISFQIVYSAGLFSLLKKVSQLVEMSLLDEVSTC